MQRAFDQSAIKPIQQMMKAAMQKTSDPVQTIAEPIPPVDQGASSVHALRSHAINMHPIMVVCKIEPLACSAECGLNQGMDRPRQLFPFDRRTLLITGLLCWGVFTMVAALTFAGRMSTFDTAGLLYWREQGSLAPAAPVWLQHVIPIFTDMGGVIARNQMVALGIVVLLSLRQQRLALYLGAATMGGWLFNSTLKAVIARPRPDLVPHLVQAGGPSFPSGHSFNGTLIDLSIALAFCALSPNKSIRTLALSAAVILSAAVAWSRVWLGVHYPTDVIAGWFGGAGLALITAAWLMPSAPPQVAVR